jgi:hypothetical protein
LSPDLSPWVKGGFSANPCRNIGKMIKILDAISFKTILFGKRLQEKGKGDVRLGRKKE